MTSHKQRDKGLAKLASSTYVSERGLADVLASVKNDPKILESCSRSSIKRARDDYVNIGTTLGMLMRTMSIPHETDPSVGLEFSYVHPVSMLAYAVQHCSAYRDLFISCHNESPSSVNDKWTVCLYSDEVTIGDPLSRSVSSRKVQAIYWGVKELGSETLSCDSAWFILTCIRSDSIKSIGGLSVLTSSLVDTFFQTGTNIRHGIKLGENIVFLDIGIIVQDYDAVKHMMQSKGASGLLICVLCQNCVDHKKRHLYQNSDSLVSSYEIDVSKFRQHTPQSIRDT